jgi:aminoglycoside phosphotransferase (APT) family kinase protein
MGRPWAVRLAPYHHRTMAFPLLLDPRLVTRALDDLHAIAEAARELPEVESRLTAQLRSAEAELRRARKTADARAAALLRVLERLDADLPSLAEAVESIRSLEAATRTLAAAVGPLQGTAERLGRISDRITGRR